MVPDLQDVDDVRVAGESAHGPLFAQESFEVLVQLRRRAPSPRPSARARLVAAVDDAESAASDLLGVVEPLRLQLRREAGLITVTLGSKGVDVGDRDLTSRAPLRVPIPRAYSSVAAVSAASSWWCAAICWCLSSLVRPRPALSGLGDGGAAESEGRTDSESPITPA